MKAELNKYIETIPAVADAAALKETFWLNEKKCRQQSRTLRK